MSDPVVPTPATPPATPPAAQTLRFEAEVNQVLHLVIHSLYSHKEVFLRELVSNSSDALDKLRFRAITEPELLAGDSALEIRILPDRENHTLTIEDNGVGMSRDELAKNLGTIAHSGSRAFLETLARQKKAEGDKAQSPDVSLIGQFGVGFYSAFLVADRVDVVSRAAGASESWRWSSDAKETFTLEPAERALRGTTVTLHIKDDQRQFLDDWELRELIRRYSDYVSHPIQLRVAPAPESEGGAAGAIATYETINRGSALWQRPRAEITEEQYTEFYKHLSHDHEPPLARTHFKVEGSQVYVGLIFVPRKAPFDLHHDAKPRGVRLFVRRVFVMDNCEELLPPWLRFLRGVVDSDDLPLNVSREVLQDSAIVKAIRKQITKKTLDLLEELAKDKPEDYAVFWRSFGPVFKAGLHLEFEFKDRIAALSRFESSKVEGLTSLADYVQRMPKEGENIQEAIYYAYGESRALLEKSPHLEALTKKGYEVLFMTDPVDEWAVEAVHEYEKKPLVSVMRADLKLGATDQEKKSRDEGASAVKPLLERFRAVLQDKIEEVRASDRLTDSPCCLVVPEGAPHAYFERILKSAGHKVPSTKRILEINPTHPLVQSLRVVHERDPQSPQVAEWIELLYDQALLTEGSPIGDPNEFARRMTGLLARAAEGLANQPHE